MARLFLTYPVCITNVVAAGIEPEVRVAVLCAVLLAVVEDALEHVGNGAVVAAAVAGGQHNNVPIPRRAHVATHALRMLGYAPVPFWLALEVARLRCVVVCCDGGYRLARTVISVVLDRHVAVKSEEDDEYCDGGDGQYYGSARVGQLARCLAVCDVTVKQGWEPRVRWSTVAWHVLSGQHLKGLHVAHVGQ